MPIDAFHGKARGAIWRTLCWRNSGRSVLTRIGPTLLKSTGVVECLPLLVELLGALVEDTGQVPISRSEKPAR